MTLQEMEIVFRGRHSIRKWQEKEVPEELLLQAIELGCLAPSGGNRQPYHVYLVKNQGKIKEIADAVKAKTALMAGWPEAGELADTLNKWQRSASFFQSAPVLLVVTAGIYQSMADNLLDSRQDDPEARAMKSARDIASSRVQSAAAAITQMLLAFHLQGLGAVWMTGPVQAKKEVEEIVGIPADEDFIALIPVGYPAQQPRPTSRKPLAEIVTIID